MTEFAQAMTRASAATFGRNSGGAVTRGDGTP